MADKMPPDTNSRAGNHRGGKSGEVADFRYKRPSRPDDDRSQRRRGKRANVPRRAGEDGQSVKNRARKSAGRSKAKRDTSISSVHASQKPNFKPSRPNGLHWHSGPRPHQAYAALDLGTNNCRLLIARPSGENFTVIDAFSRVVRLGEDLAKTGRLRDDAMERTLEALTVCSEKLRRRNVYLARSVATEACRRAANGMEFIERVRRETGIVLDIITAQEEARLAVLGCHILLEQGDGPAIIFDIGGGSTELVLVESGGHVPTIKDWMSVPWGVVSLTDTVARGDGSDAARGARYQEMRRIVRESFTPFAERIAEDAAHPSVRLLGTSGTVTTLASLHLELPHYDRKAVDGLIVPSQSMRDISTRLAGLSRDQRSEVPCIGTDRSDLVVAGCAILESILDIWPAERLGVADRGIREGILRSLMATELTPTGRGLSQEGTGKAR